MPTNGTNHSCHLTKRDVTHHAEQTPHDLSITWLTSRRLRDNLQQLLELVPRRRPLVKAAMRYRRLVGVQRGEHGSHREVAHRVSRRRVHAVIVVKEARHPPAEHLQDVTQRVRDESVRAHHACQGRIEGLVDERVGLSAGGEDGDSPHAGVAGDGSYHVVADRSEERIWGEDIDGDVRSGFPCRDFWTTWSE